jgi:hypothetical protein
MVIKPRSTQKTRHQGVERVIRGNPGRSFGTPGGGFCATRPSLEITELTWINSLAFYQLHYDVQQQSAQDENFYQNSVRGE